MESKPNIIPDPSLSPYYIIVGDVGGTNLRLQLHKVSSGKSTLIREESQLVKNVASLSEGINIFLANCSDLIKSGIIVSSGCLGVAGPVLDGTVQCHYVIPHWQIQKETEILLETKVPIKLINDFVAVGYGIPTLAEEDTIKLYTPGSELVDKTICFVSGIGTGVGFCFLSKDSTTGHYITHPSEGAGHITPYETEEDKSLRLYLDSESESKWKTQNLTMQILRGQGISYIFHYLVKKSAKADYFKESSKLLAAKSLEEITPEDVTHYARDHQDEACLDTLEIFLGYYARYLADLQQLFLPYGGIYLTNSVVRELVFMFEDKQILNQFLKTLHSRGGVNELVPLYLIKCSDLAQRGCIQYLRVNKFIE